MTKILRGSIFVILISLLFVQIRVQALDDTAYNWYCKRNKDHTQPMIEKNMQFIEKYNGYYVDPKYKENNDEKVVYLTFDAGYENGNVAKILDILKEEKVTGAFFILGNLIQRNPDVVCRMADEGHTVCNHTNRHKDMTSFNSMEDFKKELESLSVLYYQTTGKEMTSYYRPPEGRFDERSLSYACELGYKTIFWSLAYADWDNNNQPTEAEAMKKLMDHMHNGAVILLHPTSETNTLILRDLIVRLKEEGYRFGTLDELTEARIEPR